jgi:hypothetical protein
MTDSFKEELIKFRLDNGLNPHEADSPIWLATLGSFIMPLPNFKWRREAIDQHDMHHMMTGYSTSVSGELCLASWELGAKCYTSIWARSLWVFLMVLGLLTQPRQTLKAYKVGVKIKT